MHLGRTDTSTIGRWWWTVDRFILAALLILIVVGAVLTMAASTATAERIGADSFHFIRRQFLFLVPALGLMFAVSLLSPKMIRRIGVLGYFGAVLALILVLFVGPEVKGATRWLNVGPISIQPSEFVKPCFAIFCGWMLAENRLDPRFPGRIIACALFLLTAGLLVMQPDIGQTLVVSAIFGVQFFLAGLPMIFVFGLGLMGILGSVGAYFMFDHVQKRIDRFLDPSSGDTYQIETAMNAFKVGGVSGLGPGEGQVKWKLPDAHTDFILAVAGEEFGVFMCLLIVMLFAFIVLRGFSRVMKEDNLFIMLATTGVLTQFGIQACINMASTLRLMPTKGMTLPFISYGGSSMLALALGMGMVLALTRTRYGAEGFYR